MVYKPTFSYHWGGPSCKHSLMDILWVSFMGSYLRQFLTILKWVCLKMLCTPLYPMVFMIMIPFLNGYFIGNIPHFQTYPNGFVEIFSPNIPTGFNLKWQIRVQSKKKTGIYQHSYPGKLPSSNDNHTMVFPVLASFASFSRVRWVVNHGDFRGYRMNRDLPTFM